jgi:hypothetical protein
MYCTKSPELVMVRLSGWPDRAPSNSAGFSCAVSETMGITARYITGFGSPAVRTGISIGWVAYLMG